MPNQVITTPEQITLPWLTRVLEAGGALTSGAVSAFDVDTGRGNWSSNAILHVRYSDGAQGQRPPRLFLKMVETDLDDESFGASEVTYYTRDYVDAANAPLGASPPSWPWALSSGWSASGRRAKQHEDK